MPVSLSLVLTCTGKGLSSSVKGKKEGTTASSAARHQLPLRLPSHLSQKLVKSVAVWHWDGHFPTAQQWPTQQSAPGPAPGRGQRCPAVEKLHHRHQHHSPAWLGVFHIHKHQPGSLLLGSSSTSYQYGLNRQPPTNSSQQITAGTTHTMSLLVMPSPLLREAAMFSTVTPGCCPLLL